MALVCSVVVKVKVEVGCSSDDGEDDDVVSSPFHLKLHLGGSIKDGGA